MQSCMHCGLLINEIADDELADDDTDSIQFTFRSSPQFILFICIQNWNESFHQKVFVHAWRLINDSNVSLYLKNVFLVWIYLR